MQNKKNYQKLILLVVLFGFIFNLKFNNNFAVEKNNENLKLTNESQSNEENLLNFLSRKRKNSEIEINEVNKNYLNKIDTNKNYVNNEIKNQNYQGLKSNVLNNKCWQILNQPNEFKNEIVINKINQPKLAKNFVLFDDSQEIDINKNANVNYINKNNLNSNYDDDWVFKGFNKQQMNYRIYEITNILNKIHPELEYDMCLPHKELNNFDYDDDCGECLLNMPYFSDDSIQKLFFENLIPTPSNRSFNYDKVIVKLNDLLNDCDKLKNCFINKLKKFYELQNEKLSDDELKMALQCYKDTKIVIFFEYFGTNRLDSCFDNLINSINNLIMFKQKMCDYNDELNENTNVKNENKITLVDSAIKSFKYIKYFYYASLFKYQHVFKLYVAICHKNWEKIYNSVMAKNPKNAETLADLMAYNGFGDYEGKTPNDYLDKSVFNYDIQKSYEHKKYFLTKIKYILNSYSNICLELKKIFFDYDKLNEIIQKNQKDVELFNKLNIFKKLFDSVNYENSCLVFTNFFGLLLNDCLPKFRRERLRKKLMTYLSAMRNLYLQDYDRNFKKLKSINKNFKITPENEESVYLKKYVQECNPKNCKNIFQIPDLSKINLKNYASRLHCNFALTEYNLKSKEETNLRKLLKKGKLIINKNFDKVMSDSYSSSGEVDSEHDYCFENVKNFQEYLNKIDIENVNTKSLAEQLVALYYRSHNSKEILLKLKNKKNKTIKEITFMKIWQTFYLNDIFKRLIGIFSKNGGLLEINFPEFEQENAQKGIGRAGFKKRFEMHIKEFKPEYLNSAGLKNPKNYPEFLFIYIDKMIIDFIDFIIDCY